MRRLIYMALGVTLSITALTSCSTDDELPYAPNGGQNSNIPIPTALVGNYTISKFTTGQNSASALTNVDGYFFNIISGTQIKFKDVNGQYQYFNFTFVHDLNAIKIDISQGQSMYIQIIDSIEYPGNTEFIISYPNGTGMTNNILIGQKN